MTLLRVFMAVAPLALGCNSVFGVKPTELLWIDASTGPDADSRADIDRDGIKDVLDSCIAPDTDLVIDTDADQLGNDVDPCPFLFGSPEPDGDGDGLGDRCDPDRSLAGDRMRCLMALTDPEMNVLMWQSLEEPSSWESGLPRVMTAQAPGTLVADWPLEAAPPATTAYSVEIRQYSPFGETTVLPRLSTLAPENAVGCTARPHRDGSWDVVTPGGVTSPQVLIAGIAVNFTLMASFSPGDSILKCRIRLSNGLTAEAEEVVALGAGKLGIRAGAPQQVMGIAVHERGDAQQ